METKCGSKKCWLISDYTADTEVILPIVSSIVNTDPPVPLDLFHAGPRPHPQTLNLNRGVFAAGPPHTRKAVPDARYNLHIYPTRQIGSHIPMPRWPIQYHHIGELCLLSRQYKTKSSFHTMVTMLICDLISTLIFICVFVCLYL